MELITTPTGLAGTIRGLTGRDGRFLADMRVSRANKIPDYILSNCWTDTSERGIYTAFAEGKNPDWGSVLIGDRDYALLQIRIASYGETYTFKATCSNGACGSRFEWDIDLAALPVRLLKKKDRETFLAGNRFEDVIPGDGRKVWFKLATGNDVLRASAHRKEIRAKQRGARLPAGGDTTNLIVESVLMRVLQIEGVEDKNPRRKIEKHRDALEDLPMRSLTGLMDVFDAHDCGLETTIEIVCQNCEVAQEVGLPFDGDFFFPRKTRPAVGSTVMKRTTEEEPEGKPEEGQKELEEEEEGT